MGSLSPLLPIQQQRGIQHHRHSLAGDFLHDGLSLPLAGGDVREVLQITPQFLLHLLRHMGDSERGGVGNLSPGREGPEEHRVKVAVREDLGVPDLVAAGENEIIGQFGVLQFLKTLKPVAGDTQILFCKGLKALVAVFQRSIMQGRVNIRRGAAEAGGLAEKGVVLIDVVVNDLARSAAALYGALCGISLQQRTVMMDMIKGDKSCFQIGLPFF